MSSTPTRRELRTSEQPEALHYAAQEAGVQHGEKSRVDIGRVQIVPSADGPDVRFCNSEIPQGRQVAEYGTGPIPDCPATIAGAEQLEGLPRGFYTLRGALIHSNGELNVTIDAKTRVECEHLVPA
ncbi:hypothetical protein KW782_01770 [Candidatus Parcubacteria bacterium]|nr:hypothetical protein [Candidatus Parcubacteria bacterium]